MAAVLDEAADLVVRGVPGWAGLLALTSLPLRFLEAHLVNRLIQLGEGASRYVDHIVSLSWLVTFALIPALWGRAVFARACSLALAGKTAGRGAPTGRALRLPLPALISYLYVAMVAELLFVAIGWTVLALPAVALFAGLAAATSALQERPGPLSSLTLPLRSMRPFAPFLGLTAVFGLAVLIAALNLYFLFQLFLWLASAASGDDLSWWVAAFQNNSHFFLLVLAGAVSAVEPFWIAALVAAVRRARARESGEDLFSWFAEIRSASEPSTEDAA